LASGCETTLSRAAPTARATPTPARRASPRRPSSPSTRHAPPACHGTPDARDTSACRLGCERSPCACTQHISGRLWRRRTEESTVQRRVLAAHARRSSLSARDRACCAQVELWATADDPPPPSEEEQAAAAGENALTAAGVLSSKHQETRREAAAPTPRTAPRARARRPRIRRSRVVVPARALRQATSSRWRGARSTRRIWDRHRRAAERAMCGEESS
jgi:hypothetical protein